MPLCLTRCITQHQQEKESISNRIPRVLIFIEETCMKNASKLTGVDQIPIITTCVVHCVQPDLMVDRIKYEYDLGIVINSSPSLAGHVCVYLLDSIWMYTHHFNWMGRTALWYLSRYLWVNNKPVHWPNYVRITQMTSADPSTAFTRKKRDLLPLDMVHWLNWTSIQHNNNNHFLIYSVYMILCCAVYRHPSQTWN